MTAHLHRRLLHHLDRLPRRHKRAILIGWDLVVLTVATAAAALLGDAGTARLPALIPAAAATALPPFFRLGLYRAIARYAGLPFLATLLRAATLATALFAAVTLPWLAPGRPLAFYTLYWMVLLLLAGGSRLVWRSLYERAHHQAANRQRVAIYGAGAAGIQMVQALQGSADHLVVALIDDRPDYWRSEVAGIAIHPPAQLPRLVEELGIAQVLLAIPSLSRRRRREILDGLERLPVHVTTLPGVSELVDCRVGMEDIREIAIEDLLGREPVAAIDALLHADVGGKAVMVTGAGGSIGAELCRQIVRLQPLRLVLFELSEFALYSIERELRHAAPRCEIVPVLGSVQDPARLESVMRAFAVETLYHAAAYKHVPMVEHNPIEGVRNNLFGTLHTATAAIAAGVATFVLISTDKAVRPTNVMGCTKRLAEMTLQALAQRHTRPRFSMVRFGNVLDSSGSVVPLFREQIARGGPVTVTHPEIVRYFMTIPEAAQLVIQAGAMGERGEVFVLDMGEPVRIIELARRMIHLAGYREQSAEEPEGEIAIRFTGLRPGEKLYEELLIGDGDLPTRHPGILRAAEEFLPWEELAPRLERLRAECAALDVAAVRASIVELVKGYRPEPQIQDWVWTRRAEKAENAALSDASSHLPR